MRQSPNSQRPEQKTCIWSILAIIFAFLFPPLGVIFGIVALVKTNNNPNLSGKVLAIIALIIGLFLSLIVLLFGIAFLAYFEVLNPARFLPEKCSMETGFTCISYKIEPYQSFITLQNGYGKTIVVNEISIGDCTTTFDATLQSEEQHVFQLTGCDKGEKKKAFKGDVVIKFTDEGSSISKTAYGTIYTKVK